MSVGTSNMVASNVRLEWIHIHLHALLSQFRLAQLREFIYTHDLT